MSSIISSVTTIFNSAIGWVGVVGDTILGKVVGEGGTVSYEPGILLVFCLIPLVGLGVGLFKRLINIG